MKIEAVDLFYLSMPNVTVDVDSSQDTLLVRVAAGNHLGWGECEASPLPSVAAFVAPMSHGACLPVSKSVLGRRLESPEDIHAIAADVEYYSSDLLQAAHTWSGIEIALWDVLGKARGLPAWKLLGYERAYPKLPYASVLFGATPEETLAAAKAIRVDGFRAAKFGWGPFGQSLKSDFAQLDAAREGLGEEGVLLIDAGRVFVEDVEAAAARLPAMERNRVTWFEEPFHGQALAAYGRLSAQSARIATAGGEACYNRQMAEHIIDFGGIRYIQIDAGRIGGLGPARQIVDYALARGAKYVNHTFTSNLLLSASLQPYAGLADHNICEFPTRLQPVARELTVTRIEPDAEGLIHLPDAPGLGIEVNPATLDKYRVDVEIRVQGQTIFVSP